MITEQDKHIAEIEAHTYLLHPSDHAETAFHLAKVVRAMAEEIRQHQQRYHELKEVNEQLQKERDTFFYRSLKTDQLEHVLSKPKNVQVGQIITKSKNHA